MPVHVNSGTSFDECLPRLEIDDKPLMYRQQFEPTVSRRRRRWNPSRIETASFTLLGTFQLVRCQ